MSRLVGLQAPIVAHTATSRKKVHLFMFELLPVPFLYDIWGCTFFRPTNYQKRNSPKSLRRDAGAVDLLGRAFQVNPTLGRAFQVNPTQSSPAQSIRRVAGAVEEFP